MQVKSFDKGAVINHKKSFGQDGPVCKPETAKQAPKGKPAFGKDELQLHGKPGAEKPEGKPSFDKDESWRLIKTPNARRIVLGSNLVDKK